MGGPLDGVVLDFKYLQTPKSKLEKMTREQLIALCMNLQMIHKGQAIVIQGERKRAEDAEKKLNKLKI